MIWYYQKLNIFQIFLFLSLFSLFDFLPDLQTLWFGSQSYTVCFILTVTFHDGVTKKIDNSILLKVSGKKILKHFVINSWEEFLKKYQPLNTLYAGKICYAKKVHFSMLSETVFHLIALIFKWFELLMPDWS